MVSSVIRNVGKTTNTMQLWYGSTSSSTRKEVLRISNAVEHMLAGVHYIYPGPRCRSNVYGYVFPKAYTCTKSEAYSKSCTKDSQGKFFIYLCTNPGVYCRVGESEKIETIVHEGSHHAAAFLDDVPPSPYGRSNC